MSKRYGRRLVLADLNLQLSHGEFVLLVGPNGAGKTTFLRLLSTITSPTSGKIEWTAEADPRPETIRKSIAFVAHQSLCYDDLTAHENLLFVLRVHEVPQPEKQADHWLEVFGLSSRAHDRVAGFSRGMKQRLALARAFALAPRLYLLDEPLAALDAQGVETLLEQLRTVRGQGTVVLATHDPDPLRPMVTRTLEVRNQGVHDWGATP